MSSDLIRGPIGVLVALVAWFVLAPQIYGAVNGWYMNTQEACVVDGERFDRIVIAGSNDVTVAWEAVTGTTNASGDAGITTTTTAHLLDASSTGGLCTIVTNTATGGEITAATHYTPSGSQVENTALAATTPGDSTIAGGEWMEVSGVFTTGGMQQLIELVLQAAGLALPIGVMFALAGFANTFARTVSGHPIMAAIGTVLLLLLAGSLLTSLVPYLDDAFNAIDGNRFRMFDEGIGSLSVIVKRFWGVMLVAGMLMVGWQSVQAMRAKNALDTNRM